MMEPSPEEIAAARNISYLPETSQLLPQSPDGERGLLSSFLLNPRDVGRLCAERKITRAHFFIPMHADIYGIVLEMWAEDRPIDFILVTQIPRDRSMLDQCGGAAFVTELFTFLPTAANAAYYLEILQEKKILRDIIVTCTEYGSRSYSEQDNFPGILGELQSKISAIGIQQRREAPTMRENVKDAISALEGRLSGSGSILRTGLDALDNEVGPIERGNLLVIGGQTKAGKSVLAGQIALNLALSGKPVVYISLEMTERELTLRWLSSLARVDTRTVPSWSEGDLQRFNAAQRTLLALPLTIITRCFGLAEIVGTSQQYAARHSTGEPLAAIVLDYAQLAEVGRSSRDERRCLELGQISRTGKRLAGTLNVLFILLTQLNDEGRTKESRDLENDANLMVEVGHNKDTGERGVRVVLARSAPSGQRLKLRIIPQHTRVEDDPNATESEPLPAKKKNFRPSRTWNNQ